MWEDVSPVQDKGGGLGRAREAPGDRGNNAVVAPGIAPVVVPVIVPGAGVVAVVVVVGVG